MDLVARCGGEEFSIILPGTPSGDACKAALRVQEAVKKFQLKLAGNVFQITASFGVAEVRTGEDSAELLQRTDAALYASKQAGRDCVHWHDGDSVHRVVAGQEPALAPAASQTLRQQVRAGGEIGNPAEQHEQRLTLSIGIAQVGEGDDFLLLLKRAEETLDAADRQGGDHSCCHDGDHCVPMSEMLERIECVV